MSIDEEQDGQGKTRSDTFSTTSVHLLPNAGPHATDDLLSIMVNARDNEDQLNEEELISLSLALFLAGFETTAAQLGSTLYVLMSKPRRLAGTPREPCTAAGRR